MDFFIMVNSCRLDSLSGVDSGVSESSVLCIISLSHGSSLPVLASAGGAIVFVLEGQVGAVASSGAISPISSGNMFFMPSHSNTEYVSVTASRILLCKFSYDVNPCLLSSFQQILSSGSLPPSAGMCALPFCETVSHFIDSLLLAGHEILSYPQYQQTKRDEVLMYILSGYPERELSGFFSHISVSELMFCDFVMAHYKDVTDIKEFAALANMSVSTFTRRFRQVFNTSVSAWLISMKAADIISEIRHTDFTFGEIAFHYGFSSSSYLVRFCKKHFGKSPSELRREYSLSGANR